MPPMDIPHWARVGAKVLRLTPLRAGEDLFTRGDLKYIVVEKVDNDRIACSVFFRNGEAATGDFWWKDREKSWRDSDWAETTVYETIIRKGFQTSWDRILDDESY